MKILTAVKRIGSASTLAAAILISDRVAFAASDTWNQPGGTHQWTDGANWLSGTQYPNGSGDVASFTNNITSAQTVGVTGTVAVGTINLGDPNATHSYTLGSTATQIINLDNGASANVINTFAGDNSFIQAKLIATGANQDLTLNVNGASLSIGTASVASPMTIGTFTKNGSGPLFLGSAGSTFGSPNVFLNAGALFIMNNDSLPTNSVVIIGPTGFLHGGGGRNQTVAEIRGTGSFRDGGNSQLIVGNPSGVTKVGTTIAATGRLRPGDLTAVGQIGTLFIGQPSTPAALPQFEIGSESYFDIASYSSFDQIDIQRTTTTINGGDVYINFLSGFAPTNGAQFKLLIDSSTQGFKDGNAGFIFDNVFDNDGTDQKRFDVIWGAAPLAAENPGGLAAREVVFVYVPEPSALALVTATCLLFCRRWRR